jgi:hypothetical protein
MKKLEMILPMGASSWFGGALCPAVNHSTNDIAGIDTAGENLGGIRRRPATRLNRVRSVAVATGSIESFGMRGVIGSALGRGTTTPIPGRAPMLYTILVIIALIVLAVIILNVIRSRGRSI